MPQIVTHILSSRRAGAPAAAPRAHQDHHARATDAFSRRLAALRTHAPETLRARVRRELRAAGASIARSE